MMLLVIWMNTCPKRACRHPSCEARSLCIQKQGIAAVRSKRTTLTRLCRLGRRSDEGESLHAVYPRRFGVHDVTQAGQGGDASRHNEK